MRTRNLLPILISIYLFLTFWPFQVQTSRAEYPDRPITAINCWGAGGTADISFRPLVAAASRILGRPIAIEYHPGGSGGVGLGILKSKKPDGYTIGMTAASSVVHQHLNIVAYDMKRDFTPIIQYVDDVYGLAVQAESPWKSFKEFVDYARANPGKVRYSSSGPGSPAALAMESLGKQLKVNWRHIPFEGGPPALAALLGGHVESYAASMGAKPHILSGRLRLLATFGEQRMPVFAHLNVPTLHELGLPIEASSFKAIFGPKGMPPPIVETLHQAFKKAMEDPDFVKAATSIDQIIVYRNPQELAKYILKLDEEISEILRERKIRKE